MTKKPELPAIPGTVSGDMYGLLSAMRQRFMWLDEQLSAAQAKLALAIPFSTGAVFDNGVRNSSRAFQPTAKNGSLQKVQNAGAHRLEPPDENCYLQLMYQNVTGAGTVTTSDFTEVVGTGPDTTAGHYFLAQITVIEKRSMLRWTAMQ